MILLMSFLSKDRDGSGKFTLVSTKLGGIVYFSDMWWSNPHDALIEYPHLFEQATEKHFQQFPKANELKPGEFIDNNLSREFWNVYPL
jgi:hypothetical protein